MSIKFKLALPTLAVLALIILLTQLYWQPKQLANAKIDFENHTHELITLGQSGIIKNLLERDLGALFSSMEHMERSFKNRWLNITLYNENHKLIYPIFRENVDTPGKDKNLIHIFHPLTLEGTELGYITFEANWGYEKLIVIENLNKIRDTILLLIILVLLISILSQYQIIYKPIRKLAIATNKIKHGNFNTKLPPFSNDEIGVLIESFKAMQVELEFNKNALDQHAIVSTTDKHGVITNINNKFIEISGYSREELIGKSHRVIKSNTHSRTFYKEMWETITRGDLWHGEVCDLKKYGDKYWVSSTIIPFLDDQGVPQRYLSMQTDITEQKNAEKRLRHMANHDILTGLPTRRLAKEKLSSALALARRENKKTAVLFIDLDAFKAVNDTLGHNAGDLLLERVSERLTQSVREVDTVARVGGDEFLVILSSIASRESVAVVAQKIIVALIAPFIIDEQTVTIGASIGIALYPDHGQKPDELIKCADKMMYIVKRNGKNNFAFYDAI